MNRRQPFRDPDWGRVARHSPGRALIKIQFSFLRIRFSFRQPLLQEPNHRAASWDALVMGGYTSRAAEKLTPHERGAPVAEFAACNAGRDHNVPILVDNLSSRA
jgi:hypothetical protein